jgi:hypothetical protein
VSQPRLSRLRLWETMIGECEEVLVLALRELARDQALNRGEESLNRRLMRVIDAVIYDRRRDGGSMVGAPAFDSRSSPAPSDEVRAGREFKRPDFAWLWIDDLATERTKSRREIPVECKRLADGAFLRRYADNGILRFVTVEHSYGKDMESGFMVGYLQGIGLDAAVEGVNAAVADHDLPAMAFIDRDGNDEAKLSHDLDRPFAITPFRLLHIWTRLPES